MYNNREQSLDSSIITVLSIKVSVCGDDSLKGKLNRKFGFNIKSLQDFVVIKLATPSILDLVFRQIYRTRGGEFEQNRALEMFRGIIPYVS